MNDNEIPTTEEMAAFMLSQSSKLLNAKGIYEMNSYGWLDAETVDDEYVGHAMSQLEPPFEWDFINTPATIPILESWQKDCVISHSDFGGMMEMARLSIGLTLLQAEQVKGQIFADRKLFNLHWMGSMINLSIASDRLRTFLVTSIFRMTVSEYQKKDFQKKKGSWYVTPFYEASALFPTKEALYDRAEEVYKFVEKRNIITHHIATETGEFEKNRVNDQLPPMASISDYEELMKHQKKVVDDHGIRVANTIDNLNLWYNLLVKLSNDIFILDNEYRRSNPVK